MFYFYIDKLYIRTVNAATNIYTCIKNINVTSIMYNVPVKYSLNNSLLFSVTIIEL